MLLFKTLYAGRSCVSHTLNYMLCTHKHLFYFPYYVVSNPTMERAVNPEYPININMTLCHFCYEIFRSRNVNKERFMEKYLKLRSVIR